jgi:pyruvate dehydrogenase E2 component (dihydrolipoamide acetyltransferase)
MQVERLPKFAENIDSATVVKSFVKPGDLVSVGDVLFEMLTEKAEFEYTSNISGKVLAVLAGEKDEIPVGYALLVTGLDDELPLVDDIRRENLRILDAFHPAGMDIAQPQPVAAPETAAATPDAAKIRATPGARRLAKENAVDLAAVRNKLSVDGILHEHHVRKYLDLKDKK